jgi:uncharacterized protein YcbX
MIDPVISQLVIYPIKGCAGIYIDESTIGMYGLKGDRDFVIVDQSGKFLTHLFSDALAEKSILSKLLPNAISSKSNKEIPELRLLKKE